MNIIVREFPAANLGDLPILWLWLGAVTADGVALVKLDGVMGISSGYADSKTAYPGSWGFTDAVSDYDFVAAWGDLIAAVLVDYPTARFAVGYWDGTTDIAWTGSIDPQPRSVYEVTLTGTMAEADMIGKVVDVTLPAVIRQGGRVYLKTGYHGVVQPDGSWEVPRLPRGSSAKVHVPSGGSGVDVVLPGNLSTVDFSTL